MIRREVDKDLQPHLMIMSQTRNPVDPESREWPKTLWAGIVLVGWMFITNRFCVCSGTISSLNSSRVRITSRRNIERARVIIIAALRKCWLISDGRSLPRNKLSSWQLSSIPLTQPISYLSSSLRTWIRRPLCNMFSCYTIREKNSLIARCAKLSRSPK